MIFKIDLNDQDIEVIGQALDERPYKIVAPLVRRMQAQINDQQLEAERESATIISPPKKARRKG